MTDAASCPLQWRMFVPQEWADDPVRRQKSGVSGDWRPV
ncbi:transposase [Streptomyces capitiformicae]